MKKLLLLLAAVFALSSCLTTGGDSTAAGPTIEAQELMETAFWQPLTDPYGSSFVLHNELDEEGTVIVGDEVNVDFVMAKQVGANDWPDVELAVDSETSYAGAHTLTLTYKTDQELMIRLNQTDLMSAELGGDDSYALYYTTLIRSAEWKTVTVNFSDFKQPGWAEASSKAIPLKLENVMGCGLAPALNGEKGGEASLIVKSFIIQ